VVFCICAWEEEASASSGAGSKGGVMLLQQQTSRGSEHLVDSEQSERIYLVIRDRARHSPNLLQYSYDNRLCSPDSLQLPSSQSDLEKSWCYFDAGQ